MKWDEGLKNIGRIDDIPEDWAIKRLGFLFTFGKGLSITKEDLQDEGIPCVNYGEIHSKYGFEVDPTIHHLRCVDEKYLRTDKKVLLKYGDFLFADTSEDLEGSGNFTYLNSNNKTFAGYHTIILRLREEIDRRYVAYLFDSVFFRTQIRNKVWGIKVYSITQPILKNAKMIFPPPKEQQAIAAFLDAQCAKIDGIIAEMEQQIAILKQYKTSLITETVTKGLNKDAPMKDSGIEWIGKIPAHWEVKKLRYLGNFQNGINKDGEYFGSGYPFVSYGDVYNNMLLPFHVEGRIESSKKERVLYSVKEGDVFFTRTSETVEEISFSSVCGRTIPDATFAGFLIRFRPNTEELDMRYGKFYFHAELLRSFFVKEMMIVTRASLPQSLLKNLWVLLPPQKEQEEVENFLTTKCAKINDIITEKRQSIDTMRAYKKSLIYEYVTGKKRVVGNK